MLVHVTAKLMVRTKANKSDPKMGEWMLPKVCQEPFLWWGRGGKTIVEGWGEDC